MLDEYVRNTGIATTWADVQSPEPHVTETLEHVTDLTSHPCQQITGSPRGCFHTAQFKLALYAWKGSCSFHDSAVHNQFKSTNNLYKAPTTILPYRSCSTAT